MSIPSFLFLSTFVAFTSGAQYGGNSICEGYAQCVKMEFSVSSDPSVNCGGTCNVIACMKRVLCWKGPEELSHVCWNTDDCASNEGNEVFSLVEHPLNGKMEKEGNDKGFEVDKEICVTGKPGEYVFFAIKDGTYTCDGEGREVQFSSGGAGKCYKWSEQYGTCSGNLPGSANILGTCAYAVQLPNICGGSAVDSTTGSSPASSGSSPESSTGSGSTGETEGCCLETVFPTCMDVGSDHTGHLTANFPTADTSSMLAQLNAQGYGCSLPNADCPVLVCEHHIPDEVITGFSGTTCPPVP